MDPELIYTADAESHGEGRRSLALRCRRGELFRIRAGAYVQAGEWRQLPPWERHRVRIRAVVEQFPGQRILVQESAAAILGLPVIGSPGEVLLLARPPAHGRKRGDVRWVTRRLLEPITSVDGLPLTSVRQTLLDMAAYLDFECAVPAMDHALRLGSARSSPAPTSKKSLVELAGLLPSEARRLRARRVIDFADPLAESAGESYSRAVLARLGFPRPELQHVFGTPAGRFRADFYWREHRLVGEFDGALKYGRGEAPAAPSWDTLFREKRREDAIRETGMRFVRWGWSDISRPGQDPESLAQRLIRAGLPCSRRP